MPITNINRYFVGDPNIVGVVTTDDLTAITTSFYLLTQQNAINEIQKGSFEFTETDLMLIFYSGGIGFFTYDSTTQAFVPNGGSGNGNVQLPVTVGNFTMIATTEGALSDNNYTPAEVGPAVVPVLKTSILGGEVAYFPNNASGEIGVDANFNYDNTTGTLSVESGALRVGRADTTGEVNRAIYLLSTNPANGSLAITCQNNTNNTITTLATNATTDTATTFTLPDMNPDTAAAICAVTTEIPAGNLIEAGATNGKLIDSGVASSSLFSRSQVKSGVFFEPASTGTIGSIPVPGVADGWAVSVSVVSAGTDPTTYVINCSAATDQIICLLSADQLGGSLELNYIAIAPG